MVEYLDKIGLAYLWGKLKAFFNSEISDILPYGLENICLGVKSVSTANMIMNNNNSITTRGLDKDTYFYLECSEELKTDEIYTLGVYVTDVPAKITTPWPFGITDQGHSWRIYIKNGWCWATGSPKQNGKSIILDDTTPKILGTQITISNFVIVKGKQKPYYTPPISKMSVDYANTSAKATQDGSGNNIVETYQKKADVPAAITNTEMDNVLEDNSETNNN